MITVRDRLKGSRCEWCAKIFDGESGWSAIGRTKYKYEIVACPEHRPQIEELYKSDLAIYIAFSNKELLHED